MKNLTIIVFELSNVKMRKIKRLMKEANVRTLKDYLNNALTLLEWAIEEAKAGREIGSIDEKSQSYKIVVLPVLTKLFENSKKQKK